MKTKSYRLIPLLALAGLAFTAPASGHEQDKPAAPVQSAAGRLVEPTEKDAAWLAKARAEYPLKTCVVSKEDLGGVGESTDLIYRRDGSPDRLVRFCCESCIDDFKKDPAQYLQRIDAAAKPTTAGHL